MVKFISLASLLLFAIPQFNFACTMYKITKDGKTIVGNNEDWITPNTEIWFQSKGQDTYAVMYVGLMNNIPQGAINEAGLIMDGFATSILPVENTEGKRKISLQTALETAMETMSSVEEVKAYYEGIDLSGMANHQLVYIDRSGTYLIIEGDGMIMGDESEKTFSNFYYSQTSSIKEVQLPYYQKGIEFIDSTSAEPTRDYCSKVMENMIQSDISATQYSTIYDLAEMKVRLYYHHDFKYFIEFDLKEEFKKGDYKIMMADLFPEEASGKQFYLKYNNPENPYWFVEDAIGTAEYTEEQLTNAGIGFVITMLGQEWHKALGNSAAAVKVFKYGLDLMPNNTALYDGLGEIYFDLENYLEAKISFEKSLELDQKNEKAKDFLKRIDQIEKG